MSSPQNDRAIPNHSRQHGQALVEFGFIFPLFVLILFTIADMGLLFNGWMRISSGSREAAREAAVGADSATVTSVAQGYAPLGVDGSALTVKVNYCPPGSPPPPCYSSPPPNIDQGWSVTVTVTADTFPAMTPIGHMFLPLRSATSMRYEGGRAS